MASVATPAFSSLIHPAQEVSDIDLATLLGELQVIADETAGLQVLVASANPSSIIGVLGKGRCRAALGDAFVW